MKKSICYDEIQLKGAVYGIHTYLGEITNSLAMISQQLDGNRTNMNSAYIKSTVMPKINNIVTTLNNFDVIPNLNTFNIDKEIKNIEKLIKEDRY